MSPTQHNNKNKKQFNSGRGMSGHFGGQKWCQSADVNYRKEPVLQRVKLQGKEELCVQEPKSHHCGQNSLDDGGKKKTERSQARNKGRSQVCWKDVLKNILELPCWLCVCLDQCKFFKVTVVGCHMDNVLIMGPRTRSGTSRKLLQGSWWHWHCLGGGRISEDRAKLVSAWYTFEDPAGLARSLYQAWRGRGWQQDKDEGSKEIQG